MKIATFDLGSHLACAHNINGEPVVASKEFKGDRVTRAANTLAALQAMREQFEAAGGVDAVVYERPFARGQAATRALWGIAGLIEAVFGDHCAVLDWTPSEIKLWAIDNAKATKEDMVLAASLTGYTGDNEHEADAWCLLRMAEATLTKETQT